MAENPQLKINVAADTQDAVNGLNSVNQAAQNLGETLKKSPQITNQATQSLGNLSRIAQDAPYGFMGISNNINPMLESFQRLQTSAGGTGNALKAMASALTGPAGLGLAVGVLTSVVVAFGDKISLLWDKLTSGSESVAITKEILSQTKKAFVDAYVEADKLGASLEGFKNGTVQKNEVLKQYNETLGKVYGRSKDVNEVESIYIANKDNYVKAAMYRAAANLAAAKAAEEAFKQQQTASEAGTKGTIQEKIAGFGLKKLTGVDIATGTEAGIIKESSRLESVFLQIEKNFNALVDTTNASAKKSVLFGKSEEKDYTLQDKAAQLERDIAITNAWANAEMAAYEKRNAFFKKQWQIEQADRKNAPTDLTKTKLENDVPMWAKVDVAAQNKSLDLLKKQEAEYKKFAGIISRDVAQAFIGMWDALEQGKDPLEALGNMLMDIVKKLAAAVVQAAIFKGIMMAFGLGGGESPLGFMDIFKGLLGFADGGVVDRPTLAMVGEGGEGEAIMPLSKLGNLVNNTFAAGAMSGGGVSGSNGEFVLRGNDLVLALQRSNYSLNLRRG